VNDNTAQQLLLAGRSGVGKSAVAEEISAQLKRADMPHSLIDGDWLDRCFPQAPPEVFDKNFTALWRTYRTTGCNRLIYSNWASIRNAERIIHLMGDGLEVQTAGVLLLCTEDTARQRLTGREHGGGLEWHLAQLATPNDDADMHRHTPGWAHRVRTDGRRVEDIAEHVVELTRWRQHG
jgi:hypothetical protein